MSVNVTGTTGCTRSATSNASWITVTAGASGTGTGTVSLSVTANTAGTSRTGTVTVGVGVGVGSVGVVVAGATSCSVRSALRRPPVTVRPARDGMGSVLASRISFTRAADRKLLALQTR